MFDEVQMKRRSVHWCFVLKWTILMLPLVGTATFVCTFEDNNLCMWQQGSAHDDQFNWTLRRGRTPSKDTGPSADHTLKTADGHYIFIEASKPRQLNDTARLYSPVINSTTAMCLHFWYHMYGTRVNTLNVFLKTDTSIGTPVWTWTGARGDSWYNANVNIQKSHSYNIVFEGVRGTDYRGDIGLDDLAATEGPCSSTDTFVCTFEENNLCMWQQSTADDDQFDWTLRQGRTGPSRTGPSVDHTLKTRDGRYIYIKASRPRQLNDTARLYSPVINSTTTMCLHFWYHMYGTHINTLNVFLKTGTSIGTPVWTWIGARDDSWYNANVNIQKSSSYNIVFEGVIGTGSRGDIGLDDLSVTEGSCSNTAPFACTFEDNNMCMWQQSPADDDQFDWTLQQRSTPSSGTGPSVDHTLQTVDGHYIYIEATNHDPNDTARLYSPAINSTSTMCLHFWYHMNGRHVNTLNVFLKTGESVDTPVWTWTGARDDSWYNASVNMQKSSSYNIVFEGVRGTGYSGDIGLDDLSVTEGSCSKQTVEPTTTTLSTTEDPSDTSGPTITSQSYPTATTLSTTGEPSDASGSSITSQSYHTTTAESANRASDDPGDKTGLYAGIGAGVGILVVSTIIILAILYIKRRQVLAAATPQGLDNAYVNAHYDNEPPSQSQTEADYTEASTMPEYFIPEPTKSGGLSNGKAMSEDILENVYDISGEVPPYEHVYNIVNSNENDYDQTNTIGMIVRDTDQSATVPPDNVYDVSGTGANGLRMQSDNVYDIGSGMQSEVYDVIGSQPRLQTENVYDTTNCVGLEENVYDHTNNDGMTSPNQDRLVGEGYEECGHAFSEGNN